MFPRLTDNVSIVYQGGSAGFFMYYLMLLSDINFYNTNNVWEMIYAQFPSTLRNNTSAWKHTECWPNNLAIKNTSTNLKKLYLICNPLFNSTMLEHNTAVMKNTEVILLYTDLSAQLRMAYDKQSYWFTDISKTQFCAPEHTMQYLRKIKATGVEFNGNVVDPVIPQIIDKFNPQYCIKLQDIFVNIHKFNNEQQQFIVYWVELQSAKAKKLLKIDNLSN